MWYSVHPHTDISHQHTPTLLFDYSLVITQIVHYKQLLQKGPEPHMLSPRSMPPMPSHPLFYSKQPALYTYAAQYEKEFWPELQTGILGNIKSLVQDIIFNLSLPWSFHQVTWKLLSICFPVVSSLAHPYLLCSSPNISVTCQSQCLYKESPYFI